MNHIVSGRNFHGPYRVVLRGPAEGFVLSERQARKYMRELCPFSECGCGGGYGSGPDSSSAVILDGDDDLPEHLREAYRAAARECWEGPYPTRKLGPFVLIPAK